jgi:hypothetical protein
MAAKSLNSKWSRRDSNPGPLVCESTSPGAERNSSVRNVAAQLGGFEAASGALQDAAVGFPTSSPTSEVVAWVAIAALYLIRAVSLWQAETDRIASDRLLSPRRRRGERQLAFYAALGWPLFELVEVLLRVVVGPPARGAR